MAAEKVYAAFRSAPDYTAPPPSLVSLHKTLGGAINALYPDKAYNFTKSTRFENVWVGPDGFGQIKLLEIKD